MSITGNIDVPGGQVLVSVSGGDGGKQEDIDSVGWPEMKQELKEAIIGHEEYPLLHRRPQDVAGRPPARRPGNRQALSHPLHLDRRDQPHRAHLLGPAEALVRALCARSTSTSQPTLWMTPTIQGCCDVVLPLASSLEAWRPSSTDALRRIAQLRRRSRTSASNAARLFRNGSSTASLGLALNPEMWENREKDFKEFSRTPR